MPCAPAVADMSRLPQDMPALPPEMASNLMSLAARDGNAETIGTLLSMGVSANIANQIGQSALHLASMWGRLSCVELLLDAGANPSCANQFRVTPLHYAAEKNRLDVARLLVQRGADTQARAQNGMRPWEMAKTEQMREVCGKPKLWLHRAISDKDINRLEELINSGADVTEADTDGRTPLHMVILSEPGTDGEITKKMLAPLLAVGNDKAKKSALVRTMVARARDGLTPCHLAARVGSASLVGSLLSAFGAEGLGLNVSRITDMRSHAVGEYFEGNWGKKAASGSLEELDFEDKAMLHLAIERMAPDEDEESDSEDSPDRTLALQESFEVVRLLIDRGADVNAVDGDGRSPIHQAVEYGLHDVAQLLLQAGADSTAVIEGSTACGEVLLQATINGDAKMVRLLLAPRESSSTTVDVNRVGRNGWTALALAARSGNSEMVQALLACGADPAVLTATGKTAMDIALVNKRLEVIKLMEGTCA